MSRRRLSEREVIAVLLQQGAVIRCPRCKELLISAGDIEREHFHELALGGRDEVANCFYSHGACHAVVTNGTPATTAGSSKHKIAKTARMASGGRKKRYPPPRSRAPRPKPDKGPWKHGYTKGPKP